MKKTFNIMMKNSIKKNQKKIVLCGTHEVGIDIIKHLSEHNIDVSYIVSLTNKQSKKYKVSGYISYKKIAKKYNVPIYFPKDYSLKNKTDLNFFKKNKFDLLLLGGWQRLIPAGVLQLIKFGGLGLHGSPEFLPKGRGRSPINWSLINGKNKFIMHLFKLSSGIDDGRILKHKIFRINKWDTCRTLYYKNSVVSKRMLVEIIPLIFEEKIRGISQKGKPTFFPKRNPDDGQIDWVKSSSQIFNLIRAVTKPYPGAFTFIKNKKIVIWNAQPFDTQIKYNEFVSGQITEKFFTDDFVVKCGKGTLLITEYEGKVEIGDIFINKK